MELKKQSRDKLDYIENSYYFVRDEIPHSWDINSGIVSRNASDVIKIGRDLLDQIMSSCSTIKNKQNTFRNYLSTTNKSRRCQ